MASFHHAWIVDLVVLRELQALVGRAVATQNGDLLRDFVSSRGAAYARLRDAAATMLDEAVMTSALHDIGGLQGSTVREDPEATRLLELARRVSTRPRYVSKEAYTHLPKRAARLKRLIELNAPANIILGDAKLIFGTLESLDRFDYVVRGREDRTAEPLADDVLAEACLGKTYVADTHFIGLRDSPVARAFAFVGQEVFPRPTEPGELVRWSRFCGSFAAKWPPRFVGELGLAYTMKGIFDFRETVKKMRELSAKQRKNGDEALIDYAWSLKTAHENGHAVVEWLQPIEDEEIDEDDEDDEDE
jgi:hypothetical protein